MSDARIFEEAGEPQEVRHTGKALLIERTMLPIALHERLEARILQVGIRSRLREELAYRESDIGRIPHAHAVVEVEDVYRAHFIPAPDEVVEFEVAMDHAEGVDICGETGEPVRQMLVLRPECDRV